jgi:hypothetical protein
MSGKGKAAAIIHMATFADGWPKPAPKTFTLVTTLSCRQGFSG